MTKLYEEAETANPHIDRSKILISQLLLIVGFLISTSFYIAHSTNKISRGKVLGILAPDSNLSMDVPTVNKDTSGNYIFPLGQVDVLLNFTSGATNQIDSVEAIVHYDPTILSAKAITFDQSLSTQFLTQDVMKCNPIYIQKDSAGNQTGTILIARSAIPLPSECPPAVPADTVTTTFPSYSPLPINKSGPFAKITFDTLKNSTVPNLISYEFKPAFPNPLAALNDSNAPAFIPVSARDGSAFDTLNTVTNLSFVVGTPAPQSDTTPPAVSITSPLNGSTVGGSITVTATASDASGISQVDFSFDGSRVCNDTLAPYECQINLSSVGSGATHTISAKAYDLASPTPNISTDTISVSICNTDCQAPSAPTSLNVTENISNSVSLGWGASTDNVGVSGYYIYRKLASSSTFTQIGTVSAGVGTYTDRTVLASTSYNYQVKAFDAAQNFSAGSNVVTVNTPAAADTTPPTAPTAVNGNAISYSQINISWTSGTDSGSGIAGNNIYRSLSGSAGTFTKINSALITGNSYGNSGLTASTTYFYYMTAVDRANNESVPSATINVRTLDQVVSVGAISGKVTDQSGAALNRVKVSTTVNGSKLNTVTDSQGFYTFTNVMPGTYVLKFSLAKYASESINATVVSGQTVTLNAILNSH